MANQEGVKRFTELKEKILAKLSEDRIDFEVSIEYLYNELKVLIIRFSNPDIYLPNLKKFQAKHGSFNNHTQLKALKNFIEPLIIEQSVETEKIVTKSRSFEGNKTRQDVGISRFEDLQLRVSEITRYFGAMELEDFNSRINRAHQETSVLIKNYCNDEKFFQNKLTSIVGKNQGWVMQVADLVSLIKAILADLEIQKEKYENKVSDLETENKIFIEATAKITRDNEVLSRLTEKLKNDIHVLDSISDKSAYAPYIAHILFFSLMTYINFTSDKVFGLNYGNDVRNGLQIILVAILVMSFFKKIPEKVKVIIDIIVALITILTFIKGG